MAETNTISRYMVSDFTGINNGLVTCLFAVKKKDNWQSNLRKKRFTLAHSFRPFSPKPCGPIAFYLRWGRLPWWQGHMTEQWKDKEPETEAYPQWPASSSQIWSKISSTYQIRNLWLHPLVTSEFSKSNEHSVTGSMSWGLNSNTHAFSLRGCHQACTSCW